MSDPESDVEAPSYPAEQYTIGWICALPSELKAARAMLDEEHADLETQSENDDNSYVLGRIGRHHIVMPILSGYGISPATSALKSMKFTFPRLRFALMVGIGGGVPSKDNDIRLGDVVVSLPEGQGGGVIQYDFGREERDEFRRVGIMNRPPKLLLSTVNKLRSEDDLEERLTKFVTRAAKKNRKARFEPPGANKIILFESHYHHIEGNGTCDECIGKAAPTDKVELQERSDELPRIFYGNIGSGNTVMKNAIKRDEIAKKENIICFEMEAAGLMNEFPSLVIRGISDYADSHKNWDWQPYAAVVAAAYAKCLLLKISPQAVERQETIKGK